jgi:light-regulated signal transduction histidine kinase (bacteriophytochrome)
MKDQPEARQMWPPTNESFKNVDHRLAALTCLEIDTMSRANMHGSTYDATNIAVAQVHATLAVAAALDDIKHELITQRMNSSR